jgi:hypothetical protein
MIADANSGIENGKRVRSKIKKENENTNPKAK